MTPTPSTAEPSVERDLWIGDAACYLRACKGSLGDPEWRPNRDIWADLVEVAEKATKALQSTDKQDSYKLSADEHEALRDAHRASVKVVGRFVPAGFTDEVVEVLDWFHRRAETLKTEVRTAHSGRGAAASEWMREDDRDFRRDLDEALAKVSALLLKLKGQSE